MRGKKWHTKYSNNDSKLNKGRNKYVSGANDK
jgi:hypothetical protein